MNTNAIPTTNDETTPTPSSRGGRGRGAQQRNQDKFRAKKGAEFNAQNRKRIEEKCFSHLTDLSGQLAKIETKSTAVAKQIPTTTRAIGFVSQEIFNKAQARMPNSNITVFQLYRASLLQFELQVQINYTLCREEETSPKPKKNDCDRFVSMKEIILSRPRNFLPLTSIINSFGYFNSFNSTFHPYVANTFLNNVHIKQELSIVQSPLIAGEQPTICVTGPDSEGTSRTIAIPNQVPIGLCAVALERGFTPDPYVTTLSNLRDTVVALSNGNCFPEVSSYFYHRNPLPGAVWQPQNGGYKLLNPDVIMPAHYGRTEAKRDLDKVQEWLSLFKGKVGYADGVCEFSGKGAPSQLVTSSGNYRLCDDEVEISGYENFLSPDTMNDPMFFLGALSLFGEFPDTLEFEGGVHWKTSPIYSPRHHSNMSHLLPVSWDTVLQAVIK